MFVINIDLLGEESSAGALHREGAANDLCGKMNSNVRGFLALIDL